MANNHEFEQDKVRLKVYRGKQNEIDHLTPEDGALYFAKDSRKIFLGAEITDSAGSETRLIEMSSGGGGGGSGNFGFVYAAASLNDNTLIKVNSEVDAIDNPGYYISRSAFSFSLEPFTDPQNIDLIVYKPVMIEGDVLLPDVDTLVFNNDGWIFRVIEVQGSRDRVLANLISTGSGSGGGGGGGGGQAAEDLYLTMGDGWGNGVTYIYGQDYELSFVGKADRDRQIQIYTYIKDEANDIVISDGVEPELWDSEVPYVFHTDTLPITSKLTIKISIDSNNSRMLNAYKPYAEFKNIRIVRMELEKVDEDKYYPIKTPDQMSQNIQIQFIPVGDDSLVTTLHVYIDDIEQPDLNRVLKKEGVSNPYNQSNTLVVPAQSHGAHTVKLQSSVVINNSEKYSNALIYELAWAEQGNNLPVIWVGNYDPVVINYENSYIKYMVYDPLAGVTLPAAVSLYKDGQLISEVSVDYGASASSGWAEWDISNAYEVGNNMFSIICRGAKKDIEIYVTNEGARDLSLAQQEALVINYTSAGRSNLEIKSKRKVWTDETGHYPDPATLTGFNWQSNGWKKDDVAIGAVDNGTYLSLTNGASVSIPCPAITLNNENDYTIEARFRIKNVQKYSTLIQNFPLYFYEMDSYQEVPANAEFDNSVTYYTKRENLDIYDKVIISEFESGVTYYTRTPGPKSDTAALMSWIQENNKVLIYDEYGSPLMDEKNIQKIYQTTDGVVCKWLVDNTYGLVLGSQEAYFRSSRGSVNVRYKEDEVINISVVVSKTDKLVYIYLNGILSGADALPEAGTGKITINSPFVFNSDYCDIDLYRFRIYQYGLTMPEVIHNYLADIHSTTLFDQNQLTTVYDPTQVSYPLLLQYNEAHPEALTMPYAIWQIVSREDEKLPWKKGDNQMSKITFVNPSLDKALENHEIDEWYYYTHSPSFEALGVDINVQGTSSQGYPRRNYKTKFKSAAPSDKTPDYYWVFLEGSLAGERVDKDHVVLDKNGVEHTVTAKFHMDNYGLGTNKFTWKIDYMESSGTYNTGFANLMGNNKYPLYTKHPLDDLNINGDNMRSTVYGYPVLVFHEYEDATKNPSNPSAKYEYIGRYNLNLDKSSNEYFGFEVKNQQPYLTFQRAVKDDEGNPVLDEHDQPVMEDYHPAIKDIAECWELEDNQGTWCSFKFPTAAARSLGFGTPQGTGEIDSNRLEMFRHFEYRYSAYGDQLDAIGADGKYDGTTTKEAIIAEIGTTDASKSHYARNVYSNLEKLFVWLDSTDQGSATNGDIILRSVVKNGNNWEIQETTVPSVTYTTTVDYTGEDGATSTEIAANQYTTVFTKDTGKYRLEKFRNEFNEHLDKEYCLVYFVLTELLLCYDSRGKNMMLASFGPHRAGGDYVWYPMFYDIDTQLGLNNSGAYLWDYDADVTEEGLFSTPSSVLWTNLYAVFKEDIKNKYRILRGADDGSEVHGSLTYENIAGAYECNPKVFDSYAMKGIRPIIAIGLDEYYKYFATTKTGYFDTSGTKIIEGTPQYAYACQGDKKLTTELLLRNRLNYIDSWWMGGDYEITAVKQGQFWGRVNGNRGTKTSDKYLDLTAEEIAAQAQADPKYNGFLPATYPKAYFDSQPGFKLKPFLKQYVSYFIDEVPTEPQKYTAKDTEADGVWTKTPLDVEATYKTVAEMPNEQLNYIPGVDYLSSMGDLSTSYFSEFTLTAGKRLLDLTLGSDIPDYENALIDADKKFDIADDKTSSTKKALLKKIVMTGMTTFDKTLDVSGSEKLQEFRALRTALPSVYFADGAPLHTIHLPSSLETLKLIETNELTNIITSTPQVFKQFDENGVAEFYEPATYRGLYVQGATDYVSGSPGHKLNQLIIEGGGLGYGSYTLLKNLVNAKAAASTNNTLSISLKDVYWCPYEQVQYGETRLDGINYYILTDHNTFASYTDTNAQNWDFNTLNGLIYTYNSAMDKTTIETTELFDNFITWRNNGQFTNTSDAATSVPTITGTVFIANGNGTAIDEEYLTSYYGEYYPSLTIYAENVDEKNVTKYVNILDSGKIEVVDIKRGSTDHPLMLTAEHPNKTNFDFKGWADSNGNIIIAYDDISGTYVDVEESLENISFTSMGTNVITLYAKFEDHAFKMRFYNADNTLLDTVNYIYSNQQGIIPTNIVPSYTDASLELTEVYKWLGWARKNVGNEDEVIDVTKLHPTNDMNFIAVYEKTSVYDNILDTKYLTFNANTGTVSLNLNYKLEGKITLPTMIDDVPVTQISGFGGNGDINHNITHIFWALENRALTTIVGSCFRDSVNLVYYEQPNTCRTIGGQAFSGCRRLGIEDNSIIADIFRPVKNLTGANILEALGRAQAEKQHLMMPGTTFDQIASYAFGGLGNITHLQIGSAADPCKWFNMAGSILTTDAGFWSMGSDTMGGLESLKIYISSADNTAANRELILTHLGARKTDSTTITDAMMAQNDLAANYVWIEVS